MSLRVHHSWDAASKDARPLEIVIEIVQPRHDEADEKLYIVGPTESASLRVFEAINMRRPFMDCPIAVIKNLPTVLGV